MPFWNVKFANSALSRYLIASCLKESIAYIAIFSSEWLPAAIKWIERTANILPQTWSEKFHMLSTRLKIRLIQGWTQAHILTSQSSHLHIPQICQEVTKNTISQNNTVKEPKTLRSTLKHKETQHWQITIRIRYGQVLTFFQQHVELWCGFLHLETTVLSQSRQSLGLSFCLAEC